MAAQGKTRVRVYLSIWLFVLSSIAFMDRGNISIAGFSIMRDLQLSQVQFGSLSSAFLLGYAIFQLPAGWLAAKLGPRKMLTGGVLLWAVIAACTALLPPGIGHALALLLLLRFMLGVGEAVMYPAGNQFVARWIPTNERGKVNGLIFAGVGAGLGLSPPLVNWIVVRYGWHAAFFFSGALFLIGGIVWYIFSRDTPQEHSMVSAEELREIEAGIPSAEPKHPAATTTEMPPVGKPEENSIPWGRLFSRRDLFAMMGSYFCYGYVTWIFVSWFFIYMAKAHNVDLKRSAIYTMMPPISMMIGCLIGGVVSDKLTRSHGVRIGRCGPAAGAMFLAAILLLIGAHVESALLATVILAGGAGAQYFAQSSYWSASADIAGKASGPFSGLVNMGAQLGGALTASLTPWIAANFGWTTAFSVAAVMAACGATLWLTVHPERPLELS